MSQLFYEGIYKDEPVIVMTGYDAPCNHFFINVYKKDVAEDEEDLIFSSMDDSEADFGGGYPTIDHLADRIITLCLPAPPDVQGWRSLIGLREGNVRYRFTGAWPKGPATADDILIEDVQGGEAEVVGVFKDESHEPTN